MDEQKTRRVLHDAPYLMAYELLRDTLKDEDAPLHERLYAAQIVLQQMKDILTLSQFYEEEEAVDD